MKIEELKALDWDRAARFYEGSPDGQWDKEAALAISLMPKILALVEAAGEMRYTTHGNRHDVDVAYDAFNAKLRVL